MSTPQPVRERVSKSVTLRLTPTEGAWLEEVAARETTSVAHIIRHLLRAGRRAEGLEA